MTARNGWRSWTKRMLSTARGAWAALWTSSCKQRTGSPVRRLRRSSRTMQVNGVSNSDRAPVVQQQDTPQPAGRGRCDPDPGAPLIRPKDIVLKPVPYLVGKDVFERHHYLHSISAGTLLLLGAFIGDRLLGAVQFSRGSTQAHRIVAGANARDGITLARLWLSDELPSNSESRVLAISLRLLHRFTTVKFIVTYADPDAGHPGHVYQASNWLYLGQSWGDDPIDIGDGRLWSARSLSNRYGTSALSYLRRVCPKAERVKRIGKHKYVYFIDPAWTNRLLVPVLPYPKEHEEEWEGYGDQGDTLVEAAASPVEPERDVP